jgi:hypothetical protein
VKVASNNILLSQFYRTAFSPNILLGQLSKVVFQHFLFKAILRNCILKTFPLRQFCGIVFLKYSHLRQLSGVVFPHFPFRQLCGVVFSQHFLFEAILRNCILTLSLLGQFCGVAFPQISEAIISPCEQIHGHNEMSYLHWCLSIT